MRGIDEIISQGSDLQRRLLIEAFEAGRSVGRREASGEMKSKIVGLIDTIANPADSQPAAFGEQTFLIPTEMEQRQLSAGMNGRAVPGTVKPTLIRLIQSTPFGITASDIEKQTGFKHNSVRGTLWGLKTEGLIEQRNDRWYPVRKDTEPVDAGQSL